MKCQFCDNKANVFYSKEVEGGFKKLNLCDSCAEEHGITSLEEFKIPEILMSDETPKISTNDEVVINLSECKSCGFTLDDLRKIGRLGCSDCYSQFGAEIKSMLKNMHKGSKHKGKMPVGMIAAMKARRKLRDLEASLEVAIAEENYEAAAKLRDELTAIKEKGGAVK